MMKRATLVAIATASFTSLAAPAWADEGAWADIEVIADDEMAELSGGFEVPGTNINIGFGAVVTSYVNGTPVLTTNITWTDAGTIVDQTMAGIGQTLDQLTPEAKEALGVDGLEDASGIVIEDEAGITALIHNVTEGSLQNIIVNNATGRDLEQDIDVTLTLPGFELIQESLSLERLGMRIGDDLNPYLD